MNRNNNIQKIDNQNFDLCIIGGGASGAGAALDATLRGLKVVLIEKNDFGSETSSRSTKLIHGGVRYLEQAFKKFDFAQLKQVKHGLEERHIVLRNAPHLARALALITPVSTWIEGLYYTIGLTMYGWFAARKDTLPGSKWLSKKEALLRLPGLSSKINSAVLYYDGQLDDARYCLALVQSAQKAGAIVVNHAEITGFDLDSDHKIIGAKVMDNLQNRSFSIKSTRFLNCTGPFADSIRLKANSELNPRMRPSKGVHAVLPANILGGKDAMLIPKTKDGRVIYAIPYEGALLLGTTDTPYDSIGKEPQLTAEESDFLIDTLRPFLDKSIDKKDIIAGFGGIRPLVVPDNTVGTTATKTLLRDHEVEVDQKSGLISLLGGKWTTYRLMAKDAIDAVCAQLQVNQSCSTEHHLLEGADGYDPQKTGFLVSQFGFSLDTATHLSDKYGVNAQKIAELTNWNPDLGKPIVEGFPYIRAEIWYTVEHEMAVTIRDFMARRIRLEITDWKASLTATPVVAEIMGAALGWTESEKQQKVSDYQQYINSLRTKSGVN